MDRLNAPTIQKRILTWYQKNGRSSLPWRKRKDPFSILVSEAMLQQTQVATAIPYYNRFLKKFPTAEALAGAPLEQVLDSWAGLGYYSRARNLHRAAQKIVGDYAGQIPRQVEKLLKLPGVGRYTAGAIASIAFNEPEPILDGNVVRILSRYFGIRQDPREAHIQRRLWDLAQGWVPKDSPGDFNQAMMDLGATVCTRHLPRCLECPLRQGCQAYQRHLTHKIPLARPSIRRKKIRYVCAIVEKNEKVLLARRPFAGLLGGLWEFPGGETCPGEKDRQALVRSFRQRLGVSVEPIRSYPLLHQTLTHRTLQIHPFLCHLKRGRLHPKGYLRARWIPRRRVGKLALTAGMSRLYSQWNKG